jgi:hypothetical protein
MRTHKTIAESLVTLQEILEVADKSNKEVVAICLWVLETHGDPWNVEIVGEWRNYPLWGSRFYLSDTVGSSTPEMISYLFSNLIPQYPEIEFEPICILRPINGSRKLMPPTTQVVAVMMVPFRGLEDVLWPKMI